MVRAVSAARVISSIRNTHLCIIGCAAGYDGLHPNEYGEYLIAHAFSLTLHNDMGLGNSPLPVPNRQDIPPRDLPAITSFQASSSPQGVTATWDFGILLLLYIQPTSRWLKLYSARRLRL